MYQRSAIKFYICILFSWPTQRSKHWLEGSHISLNVFFPAYQKEMKETFKVCNCISSRSEENCLQWIYDGIFVPDERGMWWCHTKYTSQLVATDNMDEKRLTWTELMDYDAPEAKLRLRRGSSGHLILTGLLFVLPWQEPEALAKGCWKVRKDSYWLLEEAQSGGTVHSLLVKKALLTLVMITVKKYFSLKKLLRWVGYLT